jgi:hypothetical protein
MNREDWVQLGENAVIVLVALVSYAIAILVLS